MRRPSPCWSRSGGPADVPRNAARITTATASVIMAARPKARRQQLAAKLPTARRASSATAVAAAMISANPARARRRMRPLRRWPPLRARRQRKRVRTHVRAVRPASASKASPARAIVATKSIATRVTAARAVVAATRASAAAVISADATRVAATSATAVPHTVSGRPARPRVSAIVPPIPIRHLQNWRR